MSELIPALHSGPHDCAAALFYDFDLKAAVQLERLSLWSGGRAHQGPDRRPRRFCRNGQRGLRTCALIRVGFLNVGLVLRGGEKNLNIPTSSLVISGIPSEML